MVAAGAAMAQPPAAPAPAPAAPAEAPQEHGPRVAEPAVRVTVVEDDTVRIEERRVRGEVQRIVVRRKGEGALGQYEIVPADRGRDLSSAERGAAGQRVWHVLRF
jgi:hypothetical protein